MSKNDIYWSKLFDEQHILKNVENKGFHRISAREINVYREARLMTKFDHQVQLPEIFLKNSLTIQPDSRGTYVIGHFQSYQKLPETFSVPEIVPFPEGIETLNPQNLFSESMALLCAHNAGIFDEILGEESRLTVLGRMSTGKFTYSINTLNGLHHSISVENSQCEIDSGFESSSQFAIVEAKSESVSDFLIRQLYYPYRLWKEKTRKLIVPIFLSVSDGVFNFYIFHFTNEQHYNSIELVNQKSFQIGSTEITLDDIVQILNQVHVLPEPEKVPFPQADNFSRIIDLLSQLYINQSLSQESITMNHDFDVRQTGYYTAAGRYLRLLERESNREDGVSYHLTPYGQSLMKKTFRERHLSFVESILQNTVFNKTLRLYFQQGIRPNREQVTFIMQSSSLIGVDSDSTRNRRAQTVLSWLDWILSLEHR